MDAIIELIGTDKPVRDNNGNISYTEEKRKRFCKVRSVSRSEFYDAGTQSLKPEFSFLLSSVIDYKGERELEYRGKRYVITRTDFSGDGVELIAAEKIGGAK